MDRNNITPLPIMEKENVLPPEAAVAKAPVIGEEQVKEFTQILQKYKSGKNKTEQRIVSSENWWKLRNQTEEQKNTQIGKDGGFWVNSELVEVFPEGSFTPIDVVLGQGELFVLGDNREASVDSRDPDFPVVYEKDVVGVVTYRLFPKIEKIG